MSTYAKPYRTYEEQLQLLKSRGLSVTDEPAALTYLARIGYYRLSGYLYPFRKAEFAKDPSDPTGKKLVYLKGDDFEEGTSFEHALALYVFDKRLRLLILDAIERIEIAIRVDVAYTLGAKGAFAHLDEDNLHSNFSKRVNKKTNKIDYKEWLEKHDQVIRRSKEDFLRHFIEKYDLPLPLWVDIEAWDFGLLSMFYQGMTVPDKINISTNRYGLSDWQLLESWLRSINFIRNVVAHHSRLWNKNIIDQPKLPSIGAMPLFDPIIGKPEIISRVYGPLCIISYLMKHICPNSTWRSRIKEMIKLFPVIPGITVNNMGFPPDWETHGFWET